jgi:hypothetical protein
MHNQAGQIWKQRLLGQFSSLLVPAFLKSLNYRICYYDPAADPARPEYNEHCVFVFWHEYITLILPQWGHTPLTVLCSKHRDGEIVNQTAHALGLHIVRGSSNKGGSDAIRQLRKNSHFSSIAITPDGPRGPRREMAIGPIYLASLLQMPIVPLGIGINRLWRLDTWDQFAIPKPFARVRLIMGPKIRIPQGLSREQLETSCAGVVKLLNDLTREAQHWAESGLKTETEQPSLQVRRNNKMVFDQLKQHNDPLEVPSEVLGPERPNRFETPLARLLKQACQPELPKTRMRA